MQITMRKVSDIGTMDRVFSPHEDNRFRDYLRNRYERTMEYLDKAATGAGRDFLERTKRIFESVNNSEALRKTRIAVRTAIGIRKGNVIYGVKDLGTFQTVGTRMQRFLMADPVLRDKVQRQLADGYSDTYWDPDPKAIKDDHYEYRRVINGVWRMEKNDQGEDVMVHEHIYEQLLDGDRELDPDEQATVLDAWDIQRMFIEAGYDTSCRHGGDIG